MALHANDVAALSGPASLRRYSTAFLAGAHRRLLELGVRARGNIDHHAAEEIELIDYRIGYWQVLGRKHIAQLESKGTLPSHRRIVRNVKIEIAPPLLRELGALAPIVGKLRASEGGDIAAVNVVAGAPKPGKRSRRKGIYQAPQRMRARTVLRRMFRDTDGGPPEEMPTPDLWDRFCIEYDRVEGKANPPTKYGQPSKDSLLREVGRR